MNIHISDWLDWQSRDRMPTDPGVYMIAKGQKDEVIYVGKLIFIGLPRLGRRATQAV
jgi:hypothetical protein